MTPKPTVSLGGIILFFSETDFNLFQLNTVKLVERLGL